MSTERTSNITLDVVSPDLLRNGRHEELNNNGFSLIPVELSESVHEVVIATSPFVPLQDNKLSEEGIEAALTEFSQRMENIGFDGLVVNLPDGYLVSKLIRGMAKAEEMESYGQLARCRLVTANREPGFFDVTAFSQLPDMRGRLRGLRGDLSSYTQRGITGSKDISLIEGPLGIMPFAATEQFFADYAQNHQPQA